MIDIPKTRAALERAVNTLCLDGDFSGEDERLLRTLSAALGQAQEAWQSTVSLSVVYVVPSLKADKVSDLRPVLIIPADATDKPEDLKSFPPHPNDSRSDVL